MGNRIDVINIQQYIDAIELIQPDVKAGWEKRKDEVLKQALISIEKGELSKEKLLTLEEPYTGPCGCMGPMNDNILCGCDLVWSQYRFRYHLYNELDLE